MRIFGTSSDAATVHLTRDHETFTSAADIIYTSFKKNKIGSRISLFSHHIYYTGSLNNPCFGFIDLQ